MTEKLTQEQIDKLVHDSPGKLDDYFCRMLTAYMMGYLRMSPELEKVRQEFFRQIKLHMEGAKGITF